MAVELVKEKGIKIQPASTGKLSLERLQARDFCKRIPVDSWVWADNDKLKYGRTCDEDGVYKDLNMSEVFIININNRKSASDKWQISSVIPMSLDEKVWHGIPN